MNRSPLLTIAPSPEQYTGPWPRKKHSHRCKSCGHGVHCYKTQCHKPQKVNNCGCRR